MRDYFKQDEVLMVSIFMDNLNTLINKLRDVSIHEAAGIPSDSTPLEKVSEKISEEVTKNLDESTKNSHEDIAVKNSSVFDKNQSDIHTKSVGCTENSSELLKNTTKSLEGILSAIYKKQTEKDQLNNSNMLDKTCDESDAITEVIMKEKNSPVCNINGMEISESNNVENCISRNCDSINKVEVDKQTDVDISESMSKTNDETTVPVVKNSADDFSSVNNVSDVSIESYLTVIKFLNKITQIQHDLQQVKIQAKYADSTQILTLGNRQKLKEITSDLCDVRKRNEFAMDFDGEVENLPYKMVKMTSIVSTSSSAIECNDGGELNDDIIDQTPDKNAKKKRGRPRKQQDNTTTHKYSKQCKQKVIPKTKVTKRANGRNFKSEQVKYTVSSDDENGDNVDVSEQVSADTTKIKIEYLSDEAESVENVSHKKNATSPNKNIRKKTVRQYKRKTPTKNVKRKNDILNEDIKPDVDKIEQIFPDDNQQNDYTNEEYMLDNRQGDKSNVTRRRKKPRTTYDDSVLLSSNEDNDEENNEENDEDSDDDEKILASDLWNGDEDNQYDEDTDDNLPADYLLEECGEDGVKDYIEEKLDKKKGRPSKFEPVNCELCDITLPSANQLRKHNKEQVAKHREDRKRLEEERKQTNLDDDFPKPKRTYIKRNSPKKPKVIKVKPPGEKLTRNRAPVSKSLQCDLCGMVMDTRMHYRSHMLKHYKRYKCEICGKGFATNPQKTDHRRIHSDVRDYLCTLCGKCFKQKGGLARHILALHELASKPPQHPCQQCSKAFYNKAHLDRHQREVHINHRPFICEFCDKAFANKTNLRVHRNSHIKGTLPIKNNDAVIRRSSLETASHITPVSLTDVTHGLHSSSFSQISPGSHNPPGSHVSPGANNSTALGSNASSSLNFSLSHVSYNQPTTLSQFNLQRPLTNINSTMSAYRETPRQIMDRITNDPLNHESSRLAMDRLSNESITQLEHISDDSVSPSLEHSPQTNQSINRSIRTDTISIFNRSDPYPNSPDSSGPATVYSSLMPIGSSANSVQNSGSYAQTALGRYPWDLSKSWR